MSIPAGKLRHRVTIQQDTSTVVDDFGAPIPDWTQHRRPWAEKREVGGEESLFGLQMRAEETTLFRVRYDATITPLMRIQLSGSTGARSIIRALDPTGLTEELLITCGEYV